MSSDSVTGGLPFGTEADFALLLVGLTVFLVSTQLFSFTSSIYEWVLAEDEKSPGADSGFLMCAVGCTAICAVCRIRASSLAGTEEFLPGLMADPRDWALGFLIASILPTGISIVKAVALMSSLASAADTNLVRRRRFALGAVLLGTINLVGSIFTITEFYLRRASS